jgi:hypothetical protein
VWTVVTFEQELESHTNSGTKCFMIEASLIFPDNF